MEPLNIKLDGSEIVKASNEAVTALTALKAKFMELANATPQGQLKTQVQGILTEMTAATDAVSKMVGSVGTATAKAMQDAAKTARAGGKQIAQEVGKGLQEADIAPSVREHTRKLQAEYEKAVARGWRLKVPFLLELQQQRVGLFPDDLRQVQAYKESVQASAGVLTLRRNVLKQEQDVENERLALVARASKGLIALREAQAKQEITQAQRDSNETFRVRQLLMRQEQAQLDDHQRMLARASKGIAALRQTLAEDRAAAAVQAVAGAARAQAAAATASPAGAFSSLASGRGFGQVIDPNAPKAVKELATSERDAAAASRELHSALRGVAGASGALFLTYGSLVPLVTAFAASSAVKSSITDYKDFEYQLKFVQAIAEDTSVSLTKMMASVGGTAEAGGFSPVKAAEGMRILAQAGLSTRDALDTLPTVLEVSKVGELGMADAAMTLTGAMNAFGLTASSIDRVGDVFVKAAAISNTSVSAIAESMKQASTIAQQYKLSVEDVGTALVAMAKRNVTGSAAGTAFRSLLDELATPKGQATKIAQQLGISLFDPLKHDAKDFFDKFLPELRQKLEQFNAEAQTKIINGLATNRGAKALSALLGMSDADLQEIRKNLQEATGMSRRALIELNDSVQGDLDKLKAKTEAVFAGAGSAGADQMREILQRLKDIVGSEEFQSALAGLVGTFGLIAKAAVMAAGALMSPGGMIAAAAGLVATLTPVQGLLRAAAAEMSIFGAATTATTAASTAAATGAAGLLATLARFTLVTAAVTAVLVAVGKLYEKLSEKDPIEKAQAYTDSLIKKEKEYQTALDDSIVKLKRKLGLASGQTSDESQRQAGLLAASSEVQEALKNYEQLKAQGNDDPMLKRIYEQKAAKYKQLVDADTEALRRANERLKAEDEKRRLEGQVDAQNATKPLATGNKPFNIPDVGAANAAASELLKQQELARAARKQAYADEEEDERHREAMLKASYDRGLVNYGDYERALTDMQQQASARRRAELEAERTALEADGPKLQAALAAAQTAGAKGSKQKALNDLEQMRQKVEALNLEIKKLDDKDAERYADALTKALKPSTDLLRNSEKELGLQRLSVDQELKKLQVKNNGAQLTEREAFVQEQLLKDTASQVKYVEQVQETIAALQTSGALNSGWYDGEPSGDAAAQLKGLQDLLAKARQQLDESRGKISSVAGEAFDAKKVDEFAKSLNKDLVDALVDGGRRGSKSLRQELEDELKKPIRVVLQTLLQPATNMAASSIMSLFGIGGGGGGTPPNPFLSDSNGIAGTLGTIGSIGSMFGVGGIGGSLAAGAGWLTGATTLGGSLSAAASLVGTGTAAGALSGLGMAAGALGPIALGAMAVYALTGAGKHGGPKTESGFGTGVPLRGDPNSAMLVVQGIQQQYKQLIAGSGGTVGDLGLGVFTAQDPKGTALTQLAVNASLNGQSLYDRGARLGGIENVGRDPSELQAAIAEEVSRVLLKAMQASNIPNEIGQMLANFGDINSLSADQVQQDFDRAKKALTERQSLEDQLFDLTHNDEEKIARARERELAALDETNLALAKRIYALQDEATAAQKAADSTDKAYTTLQNAADRQRKVLQQTIDDTSSEISKLQPIADALASNIKELTGQNGSGSASSGLAFISDALAKARTGTFVDSQPLSDAIAAARSGLTEDNYSSKLAFDRDRLRLMGSLTELQSLVQPRLTSDQQALDIAQQQLKSLDDQLAYWKEQIDVERGILDVNMTVSQAINDLTAALLNERIDTARLKNDTSIVPGFATGGAPNGMALVGEQGEEFVDFQTPSRVYSADQTRGMFSTNPELVNEVRNLGARLDRLTAAVEANTTYSYKTAKVMDDIFTRGVQVRNQDDSSALQVQTV